MLFAAWQLARMVGRGLRKPLLDGFVAHSFKVSTGLNRPEKIGMSAGIWG